MSKILIVLLAGLMLVISVSAAYYIFVGAGHTISTSGDDWGNCGDYFGGVAGALLSFLSILLLVYTIHLQSQQLSDTQHEVLKRDLLVHVTKADDEIERWLQRKLATHDSFEVATEFGDIVWGIVDRDYVSTKEFKNAVIRLNSLTFLYCESLALYRSNIDSYFIFKHHKQKAQSLVDFLAKHESLIPVLARPALKFSQMHLDGEHDLTSN